MDKELQPYQQRVVEEKKELDTKIEKLSVFMRGPDFNQKMVWRERAILIAQFNVMTKYSSILRDRIGNFK